MAGTQCKALRASGMVNCGHFIGCEGRPTQFQELRPSIASGQAVFSLDNRPHIVLGNDPYETAARMAYLGLVLGVLLRGRWLCQPPSTIQASVEEVAGKEHGQDADQEEPPVQGGAVQFHLSTHGASGRRVSKTGANKCKSELVRRSCIQHSFASPH